MVANRKKRTMEARWVQHHYEHYSTYVRFRRIKLITLHIRMYDSRKFILLRKDVLYY